MCNFTQCDGNGIVNLLIFLNLDLFSKSTLCNVMVIVVIFQINLNGVMTPRWPRFV